MSRTSLRCTALPVLLGVALTAAGCPPGDAGTEKGAQAPQIVVQAPDSSPAAATAPGAAGGPTALTGAGGPQGAKPAYAGATWQNQGKETDEPYDVQALLREFDPQLVDPPNDQVGADGWNDLISAFAVIDARYLYSRIVPREPMKRADSSEVRFWLEQAGRMVTVEVKIGTRERPCELSLVDGPDEQTVVPGCYWMGNAIDLRIPLDSVPSAIDVRKPFWVSGFQTCCADEARAKPHDEIDQAQEVWRVPGLADEIESKDAQEYVPGSEEADGAPNPP